MYSLTISKDIFSVFRFVLLSISFWCIWLKRESLLTYIDLNPQIVKCSTVLQDLGFKAFPLSAVKSLNPSEHARAGSWVITGCFDVWPLLISLEKLTRWAQRLVVTHYSVRGLTLFSNHIYIHTAFHLNYFVTFRINRIQMLYQFREKQQKNPKVGSFITDLSKFAVDFMCICIHSNRLCLFEVKKSAWNEHGSEAELISLHPAAKHSSLRCKMGFWEVLAKKEDLWGGASFLSCLPG